MTRHEDWPLRLDAAIEAARGRPFAWGSHDCALFAADVVLAMTGLDYAKAFRGRYSTDSGSVRALAKYGQGTLRATVGAVLGPEMPPPFAQRGDVLLWAQPVQGDTVGICIGPRGAFVGESGLVFVPLGECSAAWRV